MGKLEQRGETIKGEQENVGESEKLLHVCPNSTE